MVRNLPPIQSDLNRWHESHRSLSIQIRFVSARLSKDFKVC
jgi:hypothetical protein